MQSTSFFKNWRQSLKTSHRLRREAKAQEDQLLQEIKRIVSETGTRIGSVGNYPQRLKTPVEKASSSIKASVDQIPAYLTFDLAQWHKEPALALFFSGSDDFDAWFKRCDALKKAFQANDPAELFGLLIGDYKEKSFLGFEMEGNFAKKDVPQTAVYFDNVHCLVPSPELAQSKQALQHRILAMLFTQELNEISDLESVRQELEKQQALLEFVLSGVEKESTQNGKDQQTAALLHDIEKQIKQMGKDQDTPEGHLKHISEALMNLDRHLSVNPLNLRVNSLGIKVKASSQEPYNEVIMAECTVSNIPRRAAVWCRIRKP